MRVIRKFVAVAVGAVSVSLAIFAVLYGITLLLIPGTLQNAYEIDSSFNEAAAFVDVFTKSHGRLPNALEFQNWAVT